MNTTIDLSPKYNHLNADCSTLECGCNHWQACAPCIARATAQNARQNWHMQQALNEAKAEIKKGTVQ
jgi:hypothetical protein